ncbi:hypothetical protein BN381_710002 [Candidatus Microthrix parvicella RN1]|uniref:Uncharacterized protein n=1 Tax=Candidatus Neomicrothrix parvicella RN1 TaxID=1229780 RepID=R4Z3Z3_9ACTN|nr:hypothetical protein BN381_710002 [Candidatus Microthrix parvicella RN1]
MFIHVFAPVQTMMWVPPPRALTALLEYHCTLSIFV